MTPQPVNYHAAKSRFAALMGSNCGGSSHRYSYLDQLVKHIQVDVWGGCGKRYNMSFSCPGHFLKNCPGIDTYRSVSTRLRLLLSF